MQQSTSSRTISILISAVLSSAICIAARLKAPFTILLADRILPGLGWVQIALLTAYAVFIASRLVSSRDTRSVRMAIWITFSSVFFLQLIAGVAGVDQLLMTGKLHIPVPAIVIAGPIYRGTRFFMPILFLCTIVLAGPAWCSYLCYFGVWDNVAANRRPRSSPRAPAWRIVRISIFVITPLTAMGLRIAGVQPPVSSWIAITFGVLGLGVSALFSARSGTMIHCTGYCPLGLAANLLGKISPFRIRISNSCSECSRCITVCRYAALDTRSIAKRRPRGTCTLCGDCIASCGEQSIGYRFLGMKPANARALFLGVIAALHACFLGIARI